MYKAVDVGGQFLTFVSFPAQANRLSTLDSRFGMGYRLWIRVLLDFLLLGPQIIKAGKIRRRRSRKAHLRAVAFQRFSSVSSRIGVHDTNLTLPVLTLCTVYLNLYSDIESFRDPCLFYFRYKLCRIFRAGVRSQVQRRGGRKWGVILPLFLGGTSKELLPLGPDATSAKTLQWTAHPMELFGKPLGSRGRIH